MVIKVERKSNPDLQVSNQLTEADIVTIRNIMTPPQVAHGEPTMHASHKSCSKNCHEKKTSTSSPYLTMDIRGLEPCPSATALPSEGRAKKI